MSVAHRKGLALLFSTEMWERFSFYAMRSLLVLYMTARILDGGLGWSRAEALQVYAIYLGAAWVTPLFGGFLSDRYLGQRFACMIGAVCMAIGHFLMAFPSLTLFYAALVLIVIGTGFFKPCMTSILGQLYEDREESERDFAYSLFYMGINIGAALSGVVAGWLWQQYGFDVGFASAGFAMLLSLLIFWWGKDRYLGDHGLAPIQKEQVDAPPLSAQDRGRIWVLAFIFFATVIFIAAFEQIGGLITLFIEERVDRQLAGYEIPTPLLANVDPFFIIGLAPLLGALWKKLGEKGRDPFLGTKIGLGCYFGALSFAILYWMAQQETPTWHWIVVNKFILVLGELCFIPISWAAVSTLAPTHYISRMMGLMLAGVGLGSYLAGYIGSWVDQIGESLIFSGLTLMLIAMGTICILMNGRLKRLAHH